MKDCYLKARAYVDWLELKDIENGDYDLYTLRLKLNGFNLDEEEGLFDCNYKSICATIRKSDKGCYVDNYIEIYDEWGMQVGICDANELKQYIKEEE